MSLIKAEKAEKSTFALEFSVDKETFEKAVTKVFRKQSANITIPGFRKGKAPRSVVERMYGKGVFYEDAANDLLPDAYEAALAEANINPVGRAEFDIKSIDENGIVFAAVVPVKPNVTIEGYYGIEATREVAPVTDAEVDAELKNTQDRYTRTTDVTDAPAAMDNLTKIDFEGFVDGVAFEGGKGTDYELKLGSGTFIPGFEEQVVGHSIGEEFDVNVTFPTEYHAAELAGKDATFKVTIKSIAKVELPELDDEFAKEVSEFDTMAEYRADIEAKIQKRHESAADAALENTVAKVLAEKLGGEEIPEAMFEAEVENTLRDFDNRLRMQGLDLNTYIKHFGMTLDKMREDARPQAESVVKVRLALEKIVELENIQASDEEVEAEYARLADAYHMDADAVKGMIPADSIAVDLKVKKAMDEVKAHAVAADAAEAKPAKKTRAKKAKVTADEDKTE